MQKITILGSTGSVGQSTLDVVALHPDKYSVSTLTANSNVDKMLAQCKVYQPKRVVMFEDAAAERLRAELAKFGLDRIEVSSGVDAICEAAQNADCDMVMSAIVGAAGLMPTLCAVRAAKRVLIANKEPLVMTGDFFMQEAAKSGAVILPIDSEHNAIFQCLPGDQSKGGVSKIHLTASGGPFRGRVWSDLRDITPEQACDHPNWSMGQKISVDSATMMNKGLELIEATALFGVPASQVNIVVHPQSIIHSMVEYSDGSFLAQLGAPDMKIPIAHSLSWPERIDSGAATLDITQIARLDFEQPDIDNMPCLRLARRAAELGGSAPAVLNASNEMAVEAFLHGRIKFVDIPLVVEGTMGVIDQCAINGIEDVLNIDNEARKVASAKIDSLAS